MGYVYKITNLKNNKIYIGITKHSIYKRFKQHCEINRKKLNYLSTSIKRYGKENFTIELLEIVDNEKLYQKEIEYIKLYNSNDKMIGYNLTIGGEGVKGHPSWLKGQTKETHPAIKLISEKQTGHSNSFYGQTHTIGQKLKWSREKRGKNHPMFGRKRPDLAERNRQNRPTDWHKFNLSLKQAKLIQCLQTKEYFLGLKRTANSLNIDVNKLEKHLNQKLDNVNNYTFQYVNDKQIKKDLVNKFLNEYKGLK